MVEITTKICDKCKKRVANNVCHYCKMDLCPDCIYAINIKIEGAGSGSGLGHLGIPFCGDCFDKIRKKNGEGSGYFFDTEFLKQIAVRMVDFIKTKKFVDEL